MNSKRKIAITCAVLIATAALLWMAIYSRPALTTYSQFLDQIHSGQVASVTVMGSNSGAVDATYRLKDGKTVRTVLPSYYRDALALMQDKVVDVEIRDSPSLLLQATPFLLLLVVWMYFMVSKFPNGLIGRRRL